jgi:hypothetical protein
LTDNEIDPSIPVIISQRRVANIKGKVALEAVKALFECTPDEASRLSNARCSLPTYSSA